MDDNGMFGKIHTAPVMMKTFNKVVLSKREGGKKEHDDFPCGMECDDTIDSFDNVDWEACMGCFETTCVEECMCDWEDEHDPCWDGCIACWDPANCESMSDWGEDDEWASESAAIDCWLDSNPCAGPCDGFVAPSEDCLTCMDDEGMFGK